MGNFDYKYNQSFIRDLHVHGTNAFPLALYKVLDTPKQLPEGVNYTSLPPHYHSEMEIFYLRSGKCSFYIDGKEYILTAGSAVLVCPDIMHWAYISDTDVNTVSLAMAFHPRFLTGISGDVVDTKYLSGIFNRTVNIPPLLSPSVPWQAEILQKYEELLSLYDESDYPDDCTIHRDEVLRIKQNESFAEIKIKSLLLDIFYLYMKNSTTDANEKKINKFALSYVLNSIEYIHEHYAEKITLSDLAQRAYMSNEYYTRVFMRYMGCRPFVYINNYRIKQSVSLLINTNLNVTNIAMKCGFATVNYYNLRFREIMNCTPTEYRRSAGHTPPSALSSNGI